MLVLDGRALVGDNGVEGEGGGRPIGRGRVDVWAWVLDHIPKGSKGVACECGWLEDNARAGEPYCMRRLHVRVV